MTHILVVGAGSIGQRHIKNLIELGVERVSVVETNLSRFELQSQKDNPQIQHYFYLQSALDTKPDAAIVAVPTHLHIQVAEKILAQLPIPLFIEKPVAHNLPAAMNLAGFDSKIVIGYSLRFHPALEIIRILLSQIGTPLYARAEVGQYLPDWHPTEDYRNWYMAHENQGGGALLDLSHEIDYMRWLFGGIHNAKGIVDQTSDLEINSDDIAEFNCIFGRDGTIGSIHMDLIDRSYNRRLRILGSEGTIDWSYNQVEVGLFLDASKEPMYIKYDPDRNIQFIEEMRTFVKLVETGELDERFSTLEDGIEVLKVVDELKRQNGRG